MLNGRPAHETARSLQKLCTIEFETDPDTEVGKVQRSQLDPEAWFFHVYVMRSGPEGRHVIRSNIIVVSDSAAAVSGPDEGVIASLLKTPVL